MPPNFATVRRLLRGLVDAVFLCSLFASSVGQAQVFRSVHSFEYAPASGFLPVAPVTVLSDGSILGTTWQGGIGPSPAGAVGCGLIYRIGPDGAYSVVHAFNGRDGAQPDTALVTGYGGALYGTTNAGGIVRGNRGLGVAYRLDGANAFTVVHRFGGTEGDVPLGLTRGADGKLYGVTQNGSAGGGAGTLFRMAADGRTTVLHTFGRASGDGSYPSGPLLLGRDGVLYGATEFGGTHGYGALYAWDATSRYRLLVSFDGAPIGNPGGQLAQATDGTLLGIAGPTVFRLTASGVAALHTFTPDEGRQPQGLTPGPDGLFYGSSQDAADYFPGALFRIDLNGSLTILHLFAQSGIEGYAPRSPLTLAPNGALYGVTGAGGPDNLGTVFQADLSGAMTTVHWFDDGVGPRPDFVISDAGGGVIGCTQPDDYSHGGIFRWGDIDRAFHALAIFDGVTASDPVAVTPLAGDDAVYGVAATGTSLASGAPGQGMVFRLDRGGALTPLHTFQGPDGSGPIALIDGGDGYLYGLTSGGGQSGNGTIFRIDRSGNFTTLYAFTGGTDGGVPTGLMRGSDGFFYGVTSGVGDGTVFSFIPPGGLWTLHTFSGADGRGPAGAPIMAADGTLYGITFAGGQFDLGTAYRVRTDGYYTLLRSFHGPNGAKPVGGLTQASDGQFYGVTLQGGRFSDGIVYRMDAFGNLTTMHTFRGTDGVFPNARLTLMSRDKQLVGTTSWGGRTALSPRGTLFTLDLRHKAVTDVTSSVSIVQSPLVRRSDGLYTLTITVTNTSATAISGHLNLALRDFNPIPLFTYYPSVDLENFDGYLRDTPFRQITANGLAAGKSAQVALVFGVSQGYAVTFTPRVYAGDL